MFVEALFDNGKRGESEVRRKNNKRVLDDEMRTFESSNIV